MGSTANSARQTCVSLSPLSLARSPLDLQLLMRSLMPSPSLGALVVRTASALLPASAFQSPEPPPTKTSPRTESNIPVMDTDSACINKVGEVYDCLSGKVAYVNCFANPAL